MVANSYVPFLSSLYRGILSDISRDVPTLAVDCGRDLNRLLSLLETRGHHFAMVSLPAFAKHFDRCLANGRFERAALDGFRPFRRHGVIPRLFKGLLLRVFKEDGSVLSNPCLFSLKAIRQLCRLAKRFRVRCSSKTIEEHTHEFVRVDQACQAPSLDWEEATFDANNARPLHLGDIVGNVNCDDMSKPPLHYLRQFADSFQRVCDIVAVTLGSYDPEEWDFRHGPGAVSDWLQEEDYKYRFPSWNPSLERVYPYARYAFANYSHWVDSVISGDRLDTIPLSKLIAVPKTLDAPRLIASEPRAHQWCQQNLKQFFYDQVSHTFLRKSISFRDQTPNQAAALDSSRSGSHATIDLSQASDRISCWIVERMFRRNPSILSALQACRTNHVRYEIRSHTFVHKLRKYSTMGSALTFPLQSLLFLCFSLSSLCYVRKIEPSMGSLSLLSEEIRVFGDDIVIPVDGVEHLVGLLHLYGLKVNRNKTFWTGKFRESCGIEAYDGINVSAAYVLGEPTYTRPESVISSIDTIQNLYDRNWIDTAMVLIRALPKRFVFSSKAPGSGVFGIPELLYTSPPPKRRRNRDTQVLEERVHVPVAKQRRGSARDNPAVLQYFTEACKALFVQGERIGPPLRSKTSLSLRWVEVRAP